MKIKVLICTYLFLFLALNINAYAEDSCQSTGNHTKITYLLIDRTDDFENKPGFETSINVIKKLIEPGERLIIGVSTDKIGSMRVLLDYVMPEKSIWTSSIKFRSTKKKFFNCIDKVKDGLLENEESHPKSALIETIRFVKNILQHDKSKSKRLVLYSDMVQNSKTISFFPLSTFNVEKMLEKLKGLEMIWDLKNIEVRVAGLGASGDNKSVLKLEKFWRSYFKESGAELDFIGPVLIK